MTKIRIRMVPGFERVLDRDPGVKRVLHDAAEEALRIAQANAPVTTGHYRESLEVEDERLSSTDPVAHIVEWGSVNNRAYATLRNAAAEVASHIRED